jgi:hypothetical protein
MGCLFALFAGLFPRLGLFIVWIARPALVNAAFDTWIFPLIGIIFLPFGRADRLGMVLGCRCRPARHHALAGQRHPTPPDTGLRPGVSLELAHSGVRPGAVPGRIARDGLGALGRAGA